MATDTAIPGKDLYAWRKDVSGGDPEVKRFCDGMFYAMEARVFSEMNDYVIEQGRLLASKLSIYANSKGYNFSEAEVLEGFKSAAPQIQNMIRESWEKVLGDYSRGEIAREEARRATAE